MFSFKRFLLLTGTFLCTAPVTATDIKHAPDDSEDPFASVLFYVAYWPARAKSQRDRSKLFFCWVGADLTPKEVTAAWDMMTGKKGGSKGTLYLLKPNGEMKSLGLWDGGKTFTDLARNKKYAPMLLGAKFHHYNIGRKDSQEKFFRENMEYETHTVTQYEDKIVSRFALLSDKSKGIKVMPMNTIVQNPEAEVYRKITCMGIPVFYNRALTDPAQLNDIIEYFTEPEEENIVYTPKAASNTPLSTDVKVIDFHKEGGYWSCYHFPKLSGQEDMLQGDEYVTWLPLRQDRFDPVAYPEQRPLVVVAGLSPAEEGSLENPVVVAPLIGMASLASLMTGAVLSRGLNKQGKNLRKLREKKQEPRDLNARPGQ